MQGSGPIKSYNISSCLFILKCFNFNFLASLVQSDACCDWADRHFWSETYNCKYDWLSTTVGSCLVPIIGHSYCIGYWERVGQYSRRIRGAKKSRWKIGCVGVWCSCIRITAAIVINPRSSWKPTFISDTDIANLHGITLQRIPAKTIRIKCLSWAACRYWVNIPASTTFQNAKSPRWVVLPPGNYPTHIPSLNWGSKKILYFGVLINI